MFSRFFAWPLTVTCGAGENSRSISIPNQAAYFKFLKSEDALEAFCETEVDLWILSYILNTTVCVLTYNLPEGQGYEGCRYEWTYFPGKLDLPGRYACQAVPLYVLNEHLVHWMRVLTVEEAAGRDDVECDTDGNGLNINQSPGQGLLSGTGVLGKKDSVAHRKKESAVQRKKESAKSKSKEVKENKVESKSRSKSVKNKEKNPSGSCKESSNKLTKKVKGKCPRKVNNSNKDKRRKIDINFEDKDKNGNSRFAAESFQVENVIKDMEDDVAVAKKSDMYHVFPLKDESLMKLLEHPSPEETAKEESFEKRCKKISERKKRSDADMERLDISISEEKARHAQWKTRLAINRLRRKRIENELSQPFLEYLLQKNQDYFEKIMRRELYSARYESYLKNGVTRDSLRYLMISNPFTEDQISVCIRELNKKLEPSFKDQMSTEFVDKVILPECLIKIFMDFFSVDKELAEKMIDETPLNTVDMGSDDCSSGDD